MFMKMTDYVVLWSSYTYVPEDTGICMCNTHIRTYIHTQIYTHIKIITTSIDYALLFALFMLKAIFTEVAVLG